MKFLFLQLSLILFSLPCNEENNTTPPVKKNQTNSIDESIFNWFYKQQLPNGLLESVENGNRVSLYDNALAAMVFMLKGDYKRAEKIFDFFDARIHSELKNGVGGFSQLRNKKGSPSSRRRWMGDNAWLLIALNNYKDKTGSTKYDYLAKKISKWLKKLQDKDGGLFSGYDSDDNLITNKVTEGNIDVFNAVKGYTSFHRKLLRFLEKNRWDSSEKSLISWPTNPKYFYALDLHPWSYLMFENYPTNTLKAAKRFLTTQKTINGIEVTGYCFDTDKDVVWLEGTCQMALAFGVAGMNEEKNFYLTEIEKTLIKSKNHLNSSGFSYASNHGTTYGGNELWSVAANKIAISSGAWYLFAKQNFNPFAVGKTKKNKEKDLFWIN